jgi:hypothetical protein
MEYARPANNTNTITAITIHRAMLSGLIRLRLRLRFGYDRLEFFWFFWFGFVVWRLGGLGSGRLDRFYVGWPVW